MSKPPGEGCSCTRRLYALIPCVVLLAGAAVTLLSWTETRTGAAGRFLTDSQIPELLRYHFQIDGLRAYLKLSRADSSSSSGSRQGGNGGVSSSSSSSSSSSGIGVSSSSRNSSSIGSSSVAAAVDLLAGVDSLASAVVVLAASTAPANRTQQGSHNASGLPLVAVRAGKPAAAAAVRKPLPPQAAAATKPAVAVQQLSPTAATKPAAAAAVVEPPPAAAATKPAAAAAVVKAPPPAAAATKPAAVAAVRQPPPRAGAAAAAPKAAAAEAAALQPVPTPAAGSNGSSSCGCWRADPRQLNRVCSVAPIRWPSDVDSLITNCTAMLATNAPAYMSYQQHDPAHNLSCSEQLLMHTYWAGPMTWKLKAVIQSFLFTHYTGDSSCRPKPVLNVWLSEQPTRQLLQQWAKQWAAPYFLCSDQLQFRHWTNDVWLDWIPDSFAERLSTDNVTVTLASLRHAVSATAAPGSKVGYSDAVRFFVLFKYGGIYTDGDVLLLRSMQPLAHLDFLYEWSFVRGGTNTAVFGLRRRSRFAGAVIQHALRQSLHVNGTNGQLTFDVRVFSSLFHPLSVLKRVSAEAREGVHTLPSILFDPVWLPLDANATKKHHPNNHAVLHCVRAWADVFVAPPAHLTLPASAREFFRGAFAHHWHNNWGQPLEPRSMMGQWVALYDRFLAGQALGAEGARYEDCSASPQTS